MRGNPQQGLEILNIARPCELAVPAYSYYNWPNLYPAYLRGEAYLASNRGNEAVAEFEKVLSHKGLVLNEPVGALAHLQLARAYVLSGDVEKGRGSYRIFLELWKDADLDIPVLQQARSEYKGLLMRVADVN